MAPSGEIFIVYTIGFFEISEILLEFFFEILYVFKNLKKLYLEKPKFWASSSISKMVFLNPKTLLQMKPNNVIFFQESFWVKKSSFG